MFGWLIALFRRMGLPERLFAVLVLVVVVEFAANSFLFERANTFELRKDDAERISENLTLAHRSLEHAKENEREEVAKLLTTSRFSLEVSGSGNPPLGALGLASLRTQVVELSPELGTARLELYLKDVPGKGNIGGSFKLSDDSVIRFRTHANTAWKLTISRFASMVFPMLLLIVLAWVLVRATLKPLRTLIRATRNLGAGPPEIVPEQGPDEMRALIRALNEMQERIHQSMVTRTQTMLAIGHDLKTPLARMRLRLDDESLAADVREGLSQDIEEMRMLLDSIQAYVESDGRSIPAELIDVAVMAETLVDTAADHGAKATYFGPPSLQMKVRPVPIRRALSNLIENAIHYGGNVRVSVLRDATWVTFTVEDDGPGIPEDQIEDALQPFVRLDSARSRDTAGMGLGLPIVSKAVATEGGQLILKNRKEGGLTATIRLPLAAN